MSIAPTADRVQPPTPTGPVLTAAPRHAHRPPALRWTPRARLLGAVMAEAAVLALLVASTLGVALVLAPAPPPAPVAVVTTA